MRVSARLNAAGSTHTGLQRDHNEDRFHCDPLRGIFFVVDGVGGQAAGEKAAETARDLLRSRLERDTGTAEGRIREAITVANNEILKQASRRPEWTGMACVLTVAVVDDRDVVIGHVGDTRLYKLRRGRIDKLTRDHSPVGEREDRHQLSEIEAMRHPRRNEVYRDVGSEPHAASDADFVDVLRVPFEPDAALLLCSDGLTDSVTSTAINELVENLAGDPALVAEGLIDAANRAGGKDNVTVVYVEGEQFVRGADTRQLTRRPEPTRVREIEPQASAPVTAETVDTLRTWRVLALVVLLLATVGLSAYGTRERWAPRVRTWTASVAGSRQIIAGPAVSIGAALAAARPGDEVLVEPGEYRERIILRDGVRVRSRVSGGASVRLPAGASEADPAVVAMDIVGAELSGFVIVGDSATPLGTGVFVRNADVTLTDLDISGAVRAGIEIAGSPGGSVLASDIHHNAGAGLVIRGAAAPRIRNNLLRHNATLANAPGPVFVEPESRPVFAGNVFEGIGPESLSIPTGADPASVARDNYFIRPPAPAPGPRDSRGRRPPAGTAPRSR